MHSLKWKFPRLLLASVVTALVVMPVALAGARQSEAARTKPAGVAKRIKALTAQVAALGSEVSQLASKPVPTTPSSLPPKGPAGGDLVGTFPDPVLRPSSVDAAAVADGSLTGADIADDTVTSVKIRDGALTAPDFAPGAVGPAALAPAQVVVGTGVPVAENQVKEAKVSCPPGTRLLSGGFEWKDNAKIGDTIIATGPDIGQNPNTDWEAVGRVLKGGEANEVRAVALCMVG